jgi:RecA/RadA recombinase
MVFEIKQEPRNRVGLIRIVTGEEASKMLDSYPVLPTGSLALDSLLEGGFKVGRVYEVFGESNTGKTQLASQVALLAAKNGTDSLFIDTEGSFRPERLQQMAESRGWDTEGLLERISYVRATSSAGQMETVASLSKRGAAGPKLVVIDSLTKNFTLDLPGASNTPRRQSRLDVHLSEMGRDAFLNGRAYLLTNRVTFSQQGRDREAHIGGKTVSQMVHASVHLTHEGEERAARIQDGDGRVEAIKIGAGGID